MVRFVFVLFSCIFVIASGLAKEAPSLCQKAQGSFSVCAPNTDWIFVDDQTPNPVATRQGMVWLHKKRQEKPQDKQINSFVVTQDRTNDFKDFDAYVHYAQDQIQAREFIIKKVTRATPTLTVFTLTTPDQKTTFFQAYTKRGDITWTLSCLGPDQEVVDTDCPRFIQSVSNKL